MQIISRTLRHAARSPGGAASASKMSLQLTAYRVRVVGRERHGRSRPAASTNRLSAVTLEPLRSRAAHVVQLRSIAAVRQDGCNGSENGQKIHPRYPNAIPHGACSDRQFRPTDGSCGAIMWNEPGGIGRAPRSGEAGHTAAIASISSRKLGLASPRRMHSVLAGGCPAK